MADEPKPPVLSDAQMDALREAYEDWCAVVEQVSAPWRERALAAEAERDALREALKRHTQHFTDSHDTELCGGCLRSSPCPDAALAEG